MKTEFTGSELFNDGACASNSQEIEVSLKTLPGKTITVNGSNLTAPEGASYQWFLDDEPIDGATSRTYEATARGVYTVLVTNSAGCSRLSDPVTATSTEPGVMAQLAFVYPNPSNGTFIFQFPNVQNELHELSLIDTAGKTYWTRQNIRDNKVEVNLADRAG